MASINHDLWMFLADLDIGSKDIKCFVFVFVFPEKKKENKVNRKIMKKKKHKLCRVLLTILDIYLSYC